MSDFEAQDLTAAGSGKSEAEVAFELVSKLKGQGVWGERNMAAILDMYAECLDAAKGLRAYEGQKRVEVAIQKSAGEPILQVAPPQTPVNMAPPPATRQAQQMQTQAPVQTQPQHMPQQAAQPVHTQQQVLAQAYKPAG
jgi:type 1 fimbria pilin